MDKKAIIICRGKSIENVIYLQNEDFDFCAIVNDFKKELKNDWLFNFIKNQKRVIHYICREPFAILNKNQYKYLTPTQLKRANESIFPMNNKVQGYRVNTQLNENNTLESFIG